MRETKKEVGEKLRALRGEKTQAYVADFLGVSVNAVSLYEKGKRTPKDDVKWRYVELFGIPVGQLFFAEKVN